MNGEDQIQASTDFSADKTPSILAFCHTPGLFLASFFFNWKLTWVQHVYTPKELSSGRKKEPRFLPAVSKQHNSSQVLPQKQLMSVHKSLKYLSSCGALPVLLVLLSNTMFWQDMNLSNLPHHKKKWLFLKSVQLTWLHHGHRWKMTVTPKWLELTSKFQIYFMQLKYWPYNK